MSAKAVLARPEFAGLLCLAEAMKGAGLPQHMRDRALSRLVGEKLRSMVGRAELLDGHMLAQTPFDHLTGDARLN